MVFKQVATSLVLLFPGRSKGRLRVAFLAVLWGAVHTWHGREPGSGFRLADSRLSNLPLTPEPFPWSSRGTEPDPLLAS